jgi:hypothetical protein
LAAKKPAYPYSSDESDAAADASYQVSVHLARQFQRRRFFKYRPIRNKNCLWWPCLLTDRDKKPAYPYSSDESDAAALNPKQQFGVSLLQ